jgi:hypothetical protein
MNKELHRIICLILGFLVSLIMFGMGGWAGAQDFPTRPVEVIVGFAPGGGTDLTARALANHATKYFGHPFIWSTRQAHQEPLLPNMLPRPNPMGTLC